MPTSRRDLAVWAGLVALGLALSWLAVTVHAVADAPLTGRYRPRIGATSLLAPVVVAIVLCAVFRHVHERLPWGWLLLAGSLAALAWAVGLALIDGTNALAGPLAGPDGYLRDVTRVGGAPGAFLRNYLTDSLHLSVDSRQHPPGAVLLLWALHRLGLRSPVQLGAVITATGCLSVPLVAVAMRSLCHEPAARRFLPVIVLAPYAIWLAGTVDAVTLTICAGALACTVVGSEPRRSAFWAVAAGLLLGVGAMLSYSAAWLGASIIGCYFVRRRPLLIVLTALAALLPLALLELGGFDWLDGMTAAQADFSRRIGPHRSWLRWSLLDVLVILLATGPAVVAAARKIRRTPGWPFLLGAALAVVSAIGVGLSRGGAERSFLPFLPWLLVAAVAPEPGADDGGGAAPTPLLLVGAGAVGAIVLAAVLRPAS